MKFGFVTTMVSIALCMSLSLKEDSTFCIVSKKQTQNKTSQHDKNIARTRYNRVVQQRRNSLRIAKTDSDIRHVTLSGGNKLADLGFP